MKFTKKIIESEDVFAYIAGEAGSINYIGCGIAW